MLALVRRRPLPFPRPLLEHGDHLKTHTHIYTFKLETDSDRAEVEAALAKLSTELELIHPLRLRGGHRSLITVPGVAPDEAWSAMDSAVPGWQRIFLPRSAV